MVALYQRGVMNGVVLVLSTVGLKRGQIQDMGKISSPIACRCGSYGPGYVYTTRFASATNIIRRLLGVGWSSVVSLL